MARSSTNSCFCSPKFAACAATAQSNLAGLGYVLAGEEKIEGCREPALLLTRSAGLEVGEWSARCVTLSDPLRTSGKRELGVGSSYLMQGGRVGEYTHACFMVVPAEEGRPLRLQGGRHPLADSPSQPAEFLNNVTQ